jgi:hypothetical protein
MNVYGNDLYSGDSSICQAALHAGMVSNRGGDVEFKIEKGENEYQASKRNSI